MYMQATLKMVDLDTCNIYVKVHIMFTQITITVKDLYMNKNCFKYVGCEHRYRHMHP